MVIVYGYKDFFRRDAVAGQATCHNCGHLAQNTLCQEIFKVTLFWIPVFRKVKQRGIMCESCGMLQPLSRHEYNERKKMS